MSAIQQYRFTICFECYRQSAWADHKGLTLHRSRAKNSKPSSLSWKYCLSRYPIHGENNQRIREMCLFDDASFFFLCETRNMTKRSDTSLRNTNTYTIIVAVFFFCVFERAWSHSRRLHVVHWHNLLLINLDNDYIIIMEMVSWPQLSSGGIMRLRLAHV
jgi:hypothetical protein